MSDLFDARERFRRFAERKSREAEASNIHPLVTLDDRSADWNLRAIGNAWTRRLYDGAFYLFDPPPRLPAISLVFVQSREGNTGVDDPETLGGGPTDKHLIYEGLSRVAANAVLAGAATVAGDDVFFSVWHPQLVALREELGLPRHPAQVVLSRSGRFNVRRTLLFNVPDVPVFVLAGRPCADRCAAAFRQRPWIRIIPVADETTAIGQSSLTAAIERLRDEHGVARISAVGGRTAATALLDARLVQDLCLTRTIRSAGEPDTPFYIGSVSPALTPIVRKQGTDPVYPIVAEQLACY